MGVPQERELSAHDILGSQGFPANFLSESIDVLSVSETVDDLRRQFVTRRYGCDTEQFLLPLYRPLYQALPQVRSEAQEALTGLGVAPELIDRYITEFDDQPYIILGFEHGDQFTDESINMFIHKTRDVMLSSLRSQLLPQGQ